MAQTLYAYKGYVYKIDGDELIIEKRYMENLYDSSIIYLTGFGEIDLDTFRSIVDDQLNREFE